MCPCRALTEQPRRGKLLLPRTNGWVNSPSGVGSCGGFGREHAALGTIDARAYVMPREKAVGTFRAWDTLGDAGWRLHRPNQEL
jgi:hypothetical protein